MHTLHITVAGKVATYSARDGSIICGNDDYQVQFALDSEWDGLAAKARFRWNGKHQDVPIVDGLAAVPRISNANEVKVGVYSEDGSLQTTTAARVPCDKSILCGDSAPTEGNEAHYASEAQEAADRAEAAADRAEAAGGNGGTGGGVVTDPESVNQAQESAQAAQESAEAAADSAQAAGQSAEAAQESAQAAGQSAEAAADSAQAAQESAQAAQESAEAAADSAQAAGQSAEEAETSKSQATAAREAAEAAESGAAQKATDAENAAQTAAQRAEEAETAQGKAETAQAAAETAQGKAEGAQAAAEAAKSTASQKATDAENAAQTATSKATEASQASASAQTAKNEALAAAQRAEEAANRWLGVVVVGIVETVNGKPAIVLTGAEESETLTAYYKVVEEDGTETLVEIGVLKPKDESEPNTYTITWIVDGKTTTTTVEEGVKPTFTGSTDKAADANYTYTFTGWTPTVVAATADATYTAQYSKTAKPVEPNYTNLANPASADWKTDKRYNSSSTEQTVTGQKLVITNLIPWTKNNDTEVHVKGLNVTGATTSGQKYGRIYTYDANKAIFGGGFNVGSASGVWKTADYDSSVTILYNLQNTLGSTCAYISLGGILTGDADDVIITFNEPIV